MTKRTDGLFLARKSAAPVLRRMKRFFYAASGAWLLVSSADAAIVAQYNFPAGAGTSLPSASTDSDFGSTASSLSVASGLANSGISSSSGNPVNSLFARGASNTTEANAFSASKYITFTVTPASGSLSYSSLSFDYRRDIASAPTSYALYASNTGSFTSAGHVAAGSLSGTSTTLFTSVSVPLTLSNLTGTETFRMYFWGAGGTDDFVRLDNIVVQASVPEPGSFAAVGIMAAGSLIGRRRNRR